MDSRAPPDRTRYLDEFEIGTVFRAPPIVVDEAEIIAFARQYDPQYFHLDSEAAKASVYGGLIASGFHTTAIAFAQFARLGLIADSSLGGPGLDEVRWLAPVRPGDALTVAAEVLEARPSRSKPDRGILRMAFTVTNQDDVPVCTFRSISIIRRRAGG